MVYNISTGWPPPTPARIGRIGSPEQDDIDTLEKKLKSTKFQSKIHSWFHEMRDVDFELLRRCVNEKLLPSKQIRRVDFSAVITQLAINKPKLVT